MLHRSFARKTSFSAESGASVVEVMDSFDDNASDDNGQQKEGAAGVGAGAGDGGLPTQLLAEGAGGELFRVTGGVGDATDVMEMTAAGNAAVAFPKSASTNSAAGEGVGLPVAMPGSARRMSRRMSLGGGMQSLKLQMDGHDPMSMGGVRPSQSHTALLSTTLNTIRARTRVAFPRTAMGLRVDGGAFPSANQCYSLASGVLSPDAGCDVYI